MLMKESLDKKGAFQKSIDFTKYHVFKEVTGTPGTTTQRLNTRVQKSTAIHKCKIGSIVV